MSRKQLRGYTTSPLIIVSAVLDKKFPVYYIKVVEQNYMSRIDGREDTQESEMVLTGNFME